MASEEALRCPAGLWRLSKEEGKVDSRGQSSAPLGAKVKLWEGASGWRSAESAGLGGEPGGPAVRSSQRKCKKRFYEIIRKHFHFSS